jgi:DNA-binding response OmpR family regulator
MQPRPLIMVVDDDMPFVQLMNELLAEEGYATECCLEGIKAYEVIRRTQPALVVLDIRLQTPETGLMILDLLRLDPTTKEMPVIICSAATDLLRASRERLTAARCDILEKPFDLATLLKQIRAVIGPP